MDMPDSCNQCKLQIGGEFYDIRCVATGRILPLKADKPDWCPLKEITKPIVVKGGRAAGQTFRAGYNACIKEILKEERDIDKNQYIKEVDEECL